jgi:RNA polymerase sigma-70 factor (ECF subfamily)
MGDDASRREHTRRRRDRALVRDVLRGNRNAQAELVDTLMPHLRAVARSIVHDSADVDDAMQVALVRVLEGLDGYRAESSLVRWARKVAAHACLRLREQSQRRLRVVELHEEHAGQRPPNDDARVDGLPRSIRDYLEQLPQVQHEVLVLRHVLDHTVAEIAELVDAPIDTVKSRLLYARRALRKAIRRDRLLSQAGRKREVGR